MSRSKFAASFSVVSKGAYSVCTCARVCVYARQSTSNTVDVGSRKHITHTWMFKATWLNVYVCVCVYDDVIFSDVRICNWYEISHCIFDARWNRQWIATCWPCSKGNEKYHMKHRMKQFNCVCLLNITHSNTRQITIYGKYEYSTTL